MRRLLVLALLSLSAQAQFQIQNSGTDASLRGVHAVSDNVVWASGTGGTVLKTEDGGTTWVHCVTPPDAEKLDFRGVQAFDTKTAVVMSSGKGDLSRVYKTTDGCRTWKLVFANDKAEGFWDSITLHPDAKSDSVEGFLLGDPVEERFMVYAISVPLRGDGGTITQLHAPSLEALPEKNAAFAASNSALFDLQHAYQAMRGGPRNNAEAQRKATVWMSQQWFVTGGTGGARAYRRIPAVRGDVLLGEGWQSSTLPIGASTATSGAFSVAFASMERGVAVGGDFTKPDDAKNTAAYLQANPKDPAGMWTPDTWLPATTPPHGYRSSVAYDAASKTWITVGPNGTDISTDDGKNWRALWPAKSDTPDADRNWNALSLPFVVGPRGRIGKLRPSALAPSKIQH